MMRLAITVIELIKAAQNNEDLPVEKVVAAVNDSGIDSDTKKKVNEVIGLLKPSDINFVSNILKSLLSGK